MRDSKYFIQGWNAYYQGRALQNPYTTQYAACEWSAGWNEAMMTDLEN